MDIHSEECLPKDKDRGLQCPFVKVIWNVKTPLKIKVFLWLIINKAILTWDNLRKKEPVGA